MSARQRAHWWIITTPPAGSRLILNGGNQSQKHYSLLGQAYHLIWCTNSCKKKSTILGHLQQPRKGIRPTQEKVIQSDPDPEQYQFPSFTQSEDSNFEFLKTVNLTGKFYTDQTGRFLVTSSKGKKYILVAYNYESNTIYAEPLKTRSCLYLKTAYQKLHSLLTNRWLKPHLHIRYNECPNVLNIFMREVNENFQLVPPHIYLRNTAERAIQTFKEHFIAGISSNHKDFLTHLCCRLLPHTSLTFNLVQQSSMNPKLSGYAQFHGEFNYNATSLAPPGTQVIIH